MTFVYIVLLLLVCAGEHLYVGCVWEFGTSTYNQIWCGKQILMCTNASASANESGAGFMKSF